MEMELLSITRMENDHKMLILNMRLLAMLSCFLLLATCSGEEPIKEDPYPWVADYCGEFRFTTKGTAAFVDMMQWPRAQPHSVDYAEDNSISRVADNKITLLKWTVVLHESKEFSLLQDTAYIDKCAGCGPGHHISYKLQLSGSFFTTDSLKFIYSENRVDGENLTSYSTTAQVIAVRIK
jgi:hypothetical protein